MISFEIPGVAPLMVQDGIQMLKSILRVIGTVLAYLASAMSALFSGGATPLSPPPPEPF